MLRYIGADAGWTLPGVPARDLTEEDLAGLDRTTTELVASGCYLPSGAADPVAAFNQARAAVTNGRAVVVEEHPVLRQIAALEPSAAAAAPAQPPSANRRSRDDASARAAVGTSPADPDDGKEA